MVDFLVSLRLFYGLLALSVLAMAVLLISYQRERQNLLLRSCCLSVLTMYGWIIAGHIYHQGHAEMRGAFCEIQAVSLNFLYIAIHAHACFMMLNNCYIALGWKWGSFEDSKTRERTLTMLAYALPSLYIVLFSVLAIGVAADAVSIMPGPFYCSVVRPRMYMSTLWFMLFAVPGSLLAVYLLYRMWRSRQKMLYLSSSTQFSLAYLARYTLSTFVYIVISFGTFVPLLIIIDHDPGPVLVDMRPSHLPRSPWLHPQLCASQPAEPELLYYFNILCPGPVSFLPACVGIALFLMYGFGAHARATYRHYFGRFFHRTKRRNSTMPLMDSMATFGAAGLQGIIELPEEEDEEGGGGGGGMGGVILHPPSPLSLDFSDAGSQSTYSS